MKYRFTPGIIFYGLLCFFCIYMLFTGYEGEGGFIFVLFALVVLVADFFLQYIVRNRVLLWTIECVSIIAIIILNTRLGN